MSSSTKKTTKTLTVVKREVFYDDSFFKDCWNDFDSAMKQVLQNFETDSTQKQIDLGNRNTCTDAYRQIRTNNIEKDLYKSQALQITEQQGNFQCVMDVKDFNPNDLQVKVVEDRIVIDGKFEKKSEDGLSMSSKSFHKEFSLPKSANIEHITTALSRDGVLTITAPMKDDSSVKSCGAITTGSQGPAVQETSSKSVDSNKSSTTDESKTETTEKKTVSTKSTFSSTKTYSMTSNASVDKTLESTNADTLPQSIQDRLVFSHDNVNMQLPENK